MYKQIHIGTKITQLTWGEGGGVRGFVVLFSSISSFSHIQKGVQIIKGLKLNVRNMFSVTMLKHINF